MRAAGAFGMKIAVVCSGLGRTRRGFESFYEDLFELLRTQMDITLFKGSGTASDREIVLGYPGRDFYQRMLGCSWQRGYRYEQIGFALRVWPYLWRGRYDVIHFSDWLVGKWLMSYREHAGLRAKLLFTDGAWIGPDYAKQVHYVHYLTEEQYQAARVSGLSESHMFLIPHGIWCDRFDTAGMDPDGLRDQYRVPRHKKVVLCVAAIEKSSKRIDWLIREFAGLTQKEYFLVVCGAQGWESDELSRMASALLGENFLFLSVSRSDVRSLYALSDIFVLPSVREGFGIVLLEAMAARVPILTHHAAHFRWLLQNPECLVDMEKPGALSGRIHELFREPGLMKVMIEANYHHVTHRYEWAVLQDQYLAMYRQIAQEPSAG